MRSRAELPRVLASLRPVATLPTPDLETCLDVAGLLGREVRPGRLAPVDEPLAEGMIALRLRHDAAAVAQLRQAAA
ncbi:aminopeptidase P family protein, partial [Pyxidicoccus sp. 3LFB2]